MGAPICVNWLRLVCLFSFCVYLCLGFEYANILAAQDRPSLPASIQNLPLQKVKLGDNSITAKLTARADITGFPCAAGYITFAPSGNLMTFALAEDANIQGNAIPKGTWVRLDEALKLKFCSFHKNTVIQSHLCRGNGGPKGVSTSFYPSGRLKGFFAPANIDIQGIPCKASHFGPIILFENGGVKECTLSKAQTIGGKSLPKGAQVVLSESGELMQ